MTRIILIRHGETEWNRVERFRGRADVPLNGTGLFQAEVTGRRIADEWRPVAIYSSPLSRAVRTAEAVAWHFDLWVEVHPGLIDIDYGEWQGLTPDEARERWPEVVDAWYNAPHTTQIPGGETLDDLRARALKTVNELSTLHKYRDQTIVLMSHTVVNRIILLGVLGLGNDHFWRLSQDTCAINVFDAEGGVFTIVRLNDTCHLRSRI
jgi:probable phosphoglycerate mutase